MIVRRLDDGKFEFQIWAPKLKSIDVVDPDGQLILSLEKTSGRMFTGTVSATDDKIQYYLRIDDRRTLPDPLSRFLPDDIHGPSELSPDQFDWSDDSWGGIDRAELVIYELHVGAFSESGTYAAVTQQLNYLVELGVTAIELLPLAECPGGWNWGYDAVNLFAPSSNYGSVDDLKRLIDDCHAGGLSVIHDVVYNHVGPEGNYLGEFGKYFSSKHGTPWGSAFNFDGPSKQRARELVIENAIYWLEEFHFDGLRLDAIHFMFDDGDHSIQQEICDRVRQFESEAGRKIHLIGEANIYDHELIVDATGDRNTYSAIWADDLMHSVYSIADAGEHLTPRTYRGGADVAEALNHGYLYQGPVMKRAGDADRASTHGDEPDLSYLSSLIIALQTHDSVGNHPQGRRLHHLAGIDFQLAAAPLFLLYPAIPMLFMGEEFAADAPFMFFADFLDESLRNNVNRGRMREYPHHDWSQSIRPCDQRAFTGSKLQMPSTDNSVLHWYTNLLSLRKEWREQGILKPENLRVHCDVGADVFGFSYCSTQQQTGNCFVLCRLMAEPADAKPQPLEISPGVVLLDSSKPKIRCDQSALARDENLRIELAANQALIGFGEVPFGN